MKWEACGGNSMKAKDVIEYIERAAGREKNGMFSVFVEDAVELVRVYGEQSSVSEELFELVLVLTDEYLQTKNAELLNEMVEFSRDELYYANFGGGAQ